MRSRGENCGIFGMYAPQYDVFNTVLRGISALQHRGQESAGICHSDATTLTFETGMGLVSQVFNQKYDIECTFGIGHTRYSTEGSSTLQNAQPLEMVDPYSGEAVAVAHNGNIVNFVEARNALVNRGHELKTNSDTEVLAHHLLEHKGSWEDRFRVLLNTVPAAYSLMVLTPTRMFAVRDRYGIRPLCIGSLGDNCIVASESCALDAVDATFIRAVAPGEMIAIDATGVHNAQLATPMYAGCAFEHIYLSKSNSILDEVWVGEQRMQMGRHLANECPADVDIVVGVPDSAIDQARGYASALGIPLVREALIKNRDGRSFIAPNQNARDAFARIKYDADRRWVEDKRIAVVDDSIVRGTTAPWIVQLLRQHGAREIHLRIASPPIRYSCHLGVDLSEEQGLVAAQMSIDEICEQVGADSLAYLSVQSMLSVIGERAGSKCTGCFTGAYPV